MRRLIAAALAAAAFGGGCSLPAATTGPTSAPAVTLHPGMSPGDRVFDLPAGRYAVTWDATGCASFEIDLMPERGSEINVPITLPTGHAIVTLPAGRTYVNSGGGCSSPPYQVKIQPAT